MLHEDKITFIIPTIGRESLKNTVDSLINQSNPNWECIIVFDDVSEVIFDDNRIKYLKINKLGRKSEHHNQAGLVRNAALEISNTKWIGFVDDDDTLHKDYVKTLFEKYEKYDLVIWRMRYISGRILPNERTNELRAGTVGISFCYKNNFNKLVFKNSPIEDFNFLNNLLK
jgi:glycosyltransferase involved in cell wall biosynthesis